MSYLKRNGGAGVVLVTMAMLVVSAQTARAEQITLTCAEGSDSTRVILDTGAQTAAYGSDPVSQATFTDAEVKWEADGTDNAAGTVDGGFDYKHFYTLNRDTGTLEYYFDIRHLNSTDKAWDNLGNHSSHCTVTKKLF